MLQRTREPRFDVEIRDPGHRAPHQIADRAVRESRVARPPHLARANRKSRVNRVALQTEAELRRGGAGVEPQRDARDVERRNLHASDRCSHRVERDAPRVVQHRARGELRPGCGEGRRPAIQRRIAAQPRQPAGVALRLLGGMQQERQLGAAQEKRREGALFGKAHGFTGPPHAARARRCAR